MLPAFAVAAALGAAKQIYSDPSALVKSDYEKKNKEELMRLENMKDNGNLGLTDKQKQGMYAEARETISLQAQRAAEEAARLSATNPMSGQSLDMQAALGTSTAGLRDEVNARVQAADVARALQQEKEYWARLQANDQYKNQRRDAWGNVIGGAIEGGAAGQAQYMLAEGENALSVGTQLKMIMQGITANSRKIVQDAINGAASQPGSRGIAPGTEEVMYSDADTYLGGYE